ncbi:MAG: efflux RND transporter periplasmic adaptor subunit [Peptoniphilus harei]|uniref:efflux RND transporter periplasmic adaptor subunit n=1 Tax=Peptoniphilus harei TaxID=54005 RepID=UPI002906C1C1|nr:efflux RND transporter periplasmic adaptor subunit [Peptoniphilus harei]MDU5470201.1 efflux RND transporter periplasmic adaptor subunit [Peptoniphilus harei]MDU6097994.1 efflux RND transporter periplasmic adaptor subunit [Peptoniphilus harei]
MKKFYTKAKDTILKNRRNKILAGGGLALILALILIPKFAGLGGGKGETISENQVVTLKKGSVTNSVSEKGKLVPSNSVEVFPEKSLPVTEVNVKVGDKVKKGDVIAKLDSSSIEQQLKSRKAQKEATDKNVSAQISAAKKRLSEAVTGQKNGKNPALVAAETSLTQAMDQYLAAEKSYNDFKRSIDERYNQGIVAEKDSRQNLAHQEEATDLRYKQLVEDLNSNKNKIAENRSLARDSSRSKDYLQSDLDNAKRRLTEIGIEISETQAKISEKQQNLLAGGRQKAEELSKNKPSKNNMIDKGTQTINAGTIENGIVDDKTSGANSNSDKITEEIKELQNKVKNLTREQSETEILIGKISEDLATAKADEQKYDSQAEALEKEVEGQVKQVESTELEVRKAKEDLYADADKALKAKKSRQDELKTLEKNLETAKNNYDNAKKNLESTKQQVANEISGLRDNLNTAKAGANNLDNVEIENLSQELDKVMIKAPADGTVTEVPAKEGQVPTGYLAKIETIDKLRIESQVKEYDKNSISVGTEVEITSDSLVGEVFRGKVISIDPAPMPVSEDNKSGEVLYKTVIEIDEGQEEKLAPGMTLRVKYILSQEKDTFKVPSDAIFDRDGKSYVLGLKNIGKNDYQVEKIEVTRGLENDAETAIKSKDLKEGDKVLATSGGYGEGSKLTLMKDPNSKESDGDEKSVDASTAEAGGVIIK